MSHNHSNSNFPDYTMNRSYIVFIAILLCSCHFVNAQGIEPGDEGKIRAGLRLGVGAGFDNQTIFTTYDGIDIHLSAGGGVAIGANIGYRLFDQLELCSDLVYQISLLDQPVSNASAKFTRFVFSPTAKYLLFLKKDKSRISINPGLGWGFYSSGTSDINASDIPNGGHFIYEYKNVSGPVVCAEFEFCTRKKLAFTGGLKYYSVEYTLDKVKIDGTTIPFNLIYPQDLKRISKVDGSGIDMYIGISWLF